MDKKVAIGIAAGVASLTGITLGATVALAVKRRFGRIFGEMQDDACEQVFTSPDGNNTVKVSFGASKTVKNMALVGVTSVSENDTNTLLTLVRKGDNLLEGKWSDNNNFQLLIGSCSNKQCCDVNFGGEKIQTSYYLRRVANK